MPNFVFFFKPGRDAWVRERTRPILPTCLLSSQPNPDCWECHFFFDSPSASPHPPTSLCRTPSGRLTTKDPALSLAASATCRALERRVHTVIGVKPRLSIEQQIKACRPSNTTGKVNVVWSNKCIMRKNMRVVLCEGVTVSFVHLRPLHPGRWRRSCLLHHLQGDEKRRWRYERDTWEFSIIKWG